MKRFPLSIALSGGGHRASLHGLGALLYLVDSGRNVETDSIVSVSGGSITNAFVAQECDFSKVTVEEFDEVAAKLVRTIVERGLLFSSWVTYAYLGLMAGLALFLSVEMIFDWPLGLRWFELLVGAAFLATLALARGPWAGYLMVRNLFGVGGHTRLGSCSTGVQHVLCSTDLNSGQPFFFEAGKNTSIYGRGVGRSEQPGFSLSEAVRASSAFPGGLPPKRLQLKKYELEWKPRTAGIEPRYERHTTTRSRNAGIEAKLGPLERLRKIAPRAVYLSDGGVWNNLATDWILRGRGRSLDKPRHLLVVDASLPMSSAPLHSLQVPGLSELLGMHRTVEVLYSSTVEPRLDALELEAAVAMNEGALASLPGAEAAGGGAAAQPADSEDAGREESWILPIVVRITEGRGQLFGRLRKVIRRMGLEVPDRLMPGSKWIKAMDKTWQIFWQEDLDRRRDSPEPGIRLRMSRVPTTLGKIERDKALDLLAHGYITAMTALYLYAGYPQGPIKGLRRFERLLEDGPRSDEPGFQPAGNAVDAL